MNEHGKHFKLFLQKHPQLTVVNATKLCEGLITQSRDLSTGITEKSVIDFYVVCQRVLPFVSKMIIGSRHTLTNFTQVTKGGKAVSTDHSPLILKVNIKISPMKPQKCEVFNFKNPQY